MAWNGSLIPRGAGKAEDNTPFTLELELKGPGVEDFLVLAPHFAEIGAIDGWTSAETVGLDDARDARKLHGGRGWELLEAWCQPPNLVVELSNWGLLGNHE